MCKEELNEVEDIEEGYLGYEELMGQISVDEELKRIQIQNSPTSKTSKDTKNSNFYKESMMAVETIGETFQKLVGYGIDYNNAVSISNNIYQNHINERQINIQQSTQSDNQV